MAKHMRPPRRRTGRILRGIVTHAGGRVGPRRRANPPGGRIISTRELTYVRRVIDPVALTFAQFVTAGVCFIVGASFSEPAPNASWLAPGVLACLVYLFLGATMLAQIMQNVGLKVTPPSQASIIMCLETVFSMVFSVLFYGETVSGAAATGFALIFLAILVSQIRLNGRLLERVGRKAR